MIEKLEQLIGFCIEQVEDRVPRHAFKFASWHESWVVPGEQLYYQSGIFGRYRRRLKRPGRVRPSSKSFPVLIEQMIVDFANWVDQSYTRPRLKAT